MSRPFCRPQGTIGVRALLVHYVKNILNLRLARRAHLKIVPKLGADIDGPVAIWFSRLIVAVPVLQNVVMGVA